MDVKDATEILPEKDKQDEKKSELWARGLVVIPRDLHIKWIESLQDGIDAGERGISDLEGALQIMEVLASGQSVETAYKVFEESFPSNNVKAIIRILVRRFSQQGQEFDDLVSQKEVGTKLSKRNLAGEDETKASPQGLKPVSVSEDTIG